MKCKLALKIDFNLRDLFYFLDSSNKGFIEQFDIERVCKYLQVPLKEKESIRLFVGRYDMDNDKKLLFTDIGKAFLPVD